MKLPQIKIDASVMTLLALGFIAGLFIFNTSAELKDCMYMAFGVLAVAFIIRKMKFLDKLPIRPRDLAAAVAGFSASVIFLNIQDYFIWAIYAIIFSLVLLL